MWRARDRQRGDALVALKVIHPHLRADRLVCERFRREAEICQSLEHPGIALAFEVVEDEQALCFSMELLQRETLKQRILSRGSLPEDEVRRIAAAALEALGVAHAAGVIHRNFKPQMFLFANPAR